MVGCYNHRLQNAWPKDTKTEYANLSTTHSPVFHMPPKAKVCSWLESSICSKVTSKTRLLPTTRMSPTSRTQDSNFTILLPGLAISYKSKSPCKASHCNLYSQTHRPKGTSNQYKTALTAILSSCLLMLHSHDSLITPSATHPFRVSSYPLH